MLFIGHVEQMVNVFKNQFGNYALFLADNSLHGRGRFF